MSSTPSTPEKDWMLATLKALADAGMMLVNELTAEAANPDAPSPPDAALKFSRLARAVRQSVALYGLVLEDGLAEKPNPIALPPRDLRQHHGATWEKTGQSEDEWRRQDRIEGRGRHAYEVIEAAIGQERDPREQDRMMVELGDRFDLGLDDDLLSGKTPIAEAIFAICEALDFELDWRGLDPEELGLNTIDLARLRTGEFPNRSDAAEALASNVSAIPPAPHPTARPPPPGPG